MKFQINIFRMLRNRIHKRRGHDVKGSNMFDEDKVTREIAKKIVDDARKHRLAINEDLKKGT